MRDAKGIWRVFPKDEMAEFKDLRKGLEINRNRDMDWVRTLEKKSSERRIGLWAEFGNADGFALTLTDEDGRQASARPTRPPPTPPRPRPALREQLGRFGATIFEVNDIALSLSQPWFVPASAQPAAPRRRGRWRPPAPTVCACRAPSPWSRPCPSPRTR
jgi:putative protease